MTYGIDLARVHDEGFGQLARDAAALLLELLDEAGATSGTVVDLGCGSGILSRRTTESGFDVFGVDTSEDMLALARSAAPAGRFEQASLFDVEIPPAVAVAAVGECLCYSDGDLADLFARVRGALQPGGVFLFDIACPGGVGLDPVRAFREGEDWVVCFEAWTDQDGTRLHRRITTFVEDRDGDGYRRADERHELRLLEPEDVRNALSNAGFVSETPAGYGATPLAAGRRAFVARPAPS